MGDAGEVDELGTVGFLGGCYHEFVRAKTIESIDFHCLEVWAIE